jgi:lysophospholipase L1-like esterase
MKLLTITIPLTLLLVSPAFSGNDTNYTYLALGDSVPYGMNVGLLPPYSSQLPTAAQFIGYPEAVAQAEHLAQSKKEVNLSCPGESSGSFLNVAVLDNGCNFPHVIPGVGSIPPFKAENGYPSNGIGLHTNYTNAQMDYAVAQLQANKHINLVTLSIGANDVLLLLNQCGTDVACVNSGLPGVLGQYAANLGQILTGLRTVYQGQLILMTYYSPQPALNTITQALNNTMLQVVTALKAQPGFAPIAIADGYDAFQIASIPFGGDPCAAGLLVKLPAIMGMPATCDIHPSQYGRDILAGTVELAQLLGSH